MAWNVEASQLDDQRHLAHALAILLTVGSTPSIYAGDEQGFRGVKEQRAGGDDAVRPPSPTPQGSSPLGWGVYRLHQRLIGVRRRHPWLHHTRATPLHLTNTPGAAHLHQVNHQDVRVRLDAHGWAVLTARPTRSACATGSLPTTRCCSWRSRWRTHRSSRPGCR
jgi:hypothetical protein